MRIRLKSLTAVVAIATACAACDTQQLLPGNGNTGGVITAGGGGGDQSGTTVLVSASSSSVAATTPVSISVSASLNNAPVPDGTQVTFNTNFGTFTDSSSPTTTAITTNGLAAANITSRTAGIATVTVSVAGVSKTASVTFTAPPG